MVTRRTFLAAAGAAAVLAAVGAGWFATVDEACTKLVSTTPVATPGSDVATYSAGYEIYRSLYPALAGPFHRLGEAAAKP